MIRKRLLAAALAIGLVAATVATAAQAAVPDRYGFLLWDGAAVSNAVPAASSVMPMGSGRYRLKFPNQAVKDGIVHVTAVNGSGAGVWCQAEMWWTSGVDEFAQVHCYAPGGVGTNSGFSAMFTRSSGALAGPGSHAYVDFRPGGGVVSQYNSAGPAISVVPMPASTWRVTLTGLGSAGAAGNLQATAVDPQIPARCKLDKWSSTAAAQEVLVRCYDAAAVPIDVRWVLSYHDKRKVTGVDGNRFGYLWNRPPAGSGASNFNSLVGINGNSVLSSPPGFYIVEFPKVGLQPDHMQVTAYGPGAGYCGLTNPWIVTADATAIARSVDCRNAAGTSADSGFFITYAAKD